MTNEELFAKPFRGYGERGENFQQDYIWVRRKYDAGMDKDDLIYQLVFYGYSPDHALEFYKSAKKGRIIPRFAMADGALVAGGWVIFRMLLGF